MIDVTMTSYLSVSTHRAGQRLVLRSLTSYSSFHLSNKMGVSKRRNKIAETCTNRGCPHLASEKKPDGSFYKVSLLISCSDHYEDQDLNTRHHALYCGIAFLVGRHDRRKQLLEPVSDEQHRSRGT
jgi:hypothetical protein